MLCLQGAKLSNFVSLRSQVVLLHLELDMCLVHIEKDALVASLEIAVCRVHLIELLLEPQP